MVCLEDRPGFNCSVVKAGSKEFRGSGLTLGLYEYESKLLASPLIIPRVVHYIIPYITPTRSLDFSTYGVCVRLCNVRMMREWRGGYEGGCQHEGCFLPGSANTWGGFPKSGASFWGPQNAEDIGVYFRPRIWGNYHFSCQPVALLQGKSAKGPL